MDNEPEVIVNLWYVGDKTGLLISLKGRAYVATGSDKEKLSFLNERALFDFMIAEDFPLPLWLKTHIGDKTYNTAYYKQIISMGMEATLFENCMVKLEEQFSKLNGLSISKQPLICVTPLWMGDDNYPRLFENMETRNFD